MPTPRPGGNGMCDATSVSYPVTPHPTILDLACLEAYLPRRVRLARISEKGTTELNIHVEFHAPTAKSECAC